MKPSLVCETELEKRILRVSLIVYLLSISSPEYNSNNFENIYKTANY